MEGVSEGTYEWQLQLLSGIRVLDHELTKGLTDTMFAAFLGHLVEVIIGQIEFILDLGTIHSWPFPWTYFLS